MAQEQKSIFIGAEDLKRIIDANCYYVDKTLMIRDLLDNKAMAKLFTRPRRFGKTLNLSMIRRFFEDERKADGTPVDNRYLFDGLAITACGEKYLQHQQQYPVISLSLKSAKQPDFAQAYTMLKRAIIGEFERHAYVLACDRLTKQEKERYQSILYAEEDKSLYADGLKMLSACLEKYHGKKCIILIDEYDVPLENAWMQGFYDEMIGFIRSLFESALKTNDSLEFGVITGCLRISKESIFTGLNNLQINSVASTSFGEAFGFTERDVKALLAYYGMEEQFGEIKTWYDGYAFGDSAVYNPWSILNYVDEIKKGDTLYPKPYWSNTSSNSIVKEIIESADQEMRGEVERLIAGEALEKPIHEEITYADIHETSDNLWNFLYFTGYLTSAGQSFRNSRIYVRMVVPNEEVRSIFENIVLRWFDEKLQQRDLRPLVKAIEEGDCDAIGNIISDALMDTISFFDYGESYYHGFLAGLLKSASEYMILSNRENGEGRTDLIMKTRRIRGGRAFILEIKVAKTFQEMEERCEEALAQIEARQYAEGLQREGYTNIAKYGICFFKKECYVIKG